MSHPLQTHSHSTVTQNGGSYIHKYTVDLPTKSVFNMYTIILAYEYKDTPFNINAVGPGYTATKFNNHTRKVL